MSKRREEEEEQGRGGRGNRGCGGDDKGCLQLGGKMACFFCFSDLTKAKQTNKQTNKGGRVRVCVCLHAWVVVKKEVQVRKRQARQRSTQEEEEEEVNLNWTKQTHKVTKVGRKAEHTKGWDHREENQQQACLHA